jgi:hypothetical protein
VWSDVGVRGRHTETNKLCNPGSHLRDRHTPHREGIPDGLVIVLAEAAPRHHSQPPATQNEGNEDEAASVRGKCRGSDWEMGSEYSVALASVHPMPGAAGKGFQVDCSKPIGMAGRKRLPREENGRVQS